MRFGDVNNDAVKGGGFYRSIDRSMRSYDSWFGLSTYGPWDGIDLGLYMMVCIVRKGTGRDIGGYEECGSEFGPDQEGPCWVEMQ